MFFGWCQIRSLFVHQQANVDNVTNEFLVALDLFQCLLQLLPYTALLGEEHGEVLGLLDGLRVRDHLQKLGGSPVGGVVVFH